MRRAGIAASLAAVGALLPGAGVAETCSPPADRAQACVDAGGSFDGGFIRSSARVGAFSGSTGLSGSFSAGEMRFENPPANGAVVCDEAGCHQEYDESFGPPVATAALGAGSLTAAVNEEGVLTALGWPGPGMYDHVNYMQVTRGWEHKGAPANGGVFGGILLPGVGVSWLRPEFGWDLVEQRYSTDCLSQASCGQTLQTVLSGTVGGIGATATITDLVDPASDVLARNVKVAWTQTPPAWRFVSYANMNPTTSRLPRAPSITDAALDNFSDFGTVYDASSEVMFHFRPYRIDPVAPTMLATGQAGVRGALEAAAGAFGPGVYIAVGGASAPDEVQAGEEAFGLVRSEAEDTPLLDPYYDSMDGNLSGSVAAFGKTAGAMAWAVPGEPDGSYTIWAAAAERPSEAAAVVAAARTRGFAAVRAGSEAWWRDWIGRARLPATDDAQTLAVSRRALIAIRTAQDRRTGAIVAGITPFTPYRQDWVRDGSFFNYALLVAGYDEMVAAHNDFYRRIWRTGGTWDSIYYPDGAEAGFVYPYEVDSQAFALWALWLPYELGTGSQPARAAELARSWDAIKATADALMACHDPTNDLQCRAAEDDAIEPTQGTQGAATVYLALRKAAEAAAVLGYAEDYARWSVRAEKLREATLGTLCQPDCASAYDGKGRGGVYLAWPSRLLEGETQLQDHLANFVDRLDAQSALAAPAVGGYLQYPMEPILALAPLWTGANKASRLDGWVDWLTHTVAAPGVGHFGERIFRVSGEPGEYPYLHSIGFPHIWSGTEAYLAAAFVYGLEGCPSGITSIGEAACL
jgi:hypothetical protein